MKNENTNNHLPNKNRIVKTKTYLPIDKKYGYTFFLNWISLVIGCRPVAEKRTRSSWLSQANLFTKVIYKLLFAII